MGDSDESSGFVIESLSYHHQRFPRNCQLESERCRRFNDCVFDYNTLAPRNILLLSGEVYVIYPAGKTSLVPKGLVVRLELLALLDYIDSMNIDRNKCYFILIDGSGAIDYSGIELVLDKLISERYPKHSVVLGKRPTHDEFWGMSNPNRKKIELFEKFLLEQKYAEKIKPSFGSELPDAQAGCWGLYIGSLKDLSLTAGGYELEFDVAASAISSGQPVTFTSDLHLQNRIGGSNVNYNTSIRKLEFIIHKLDYTKFDLFNILEKYKQIIRHNKSKQLPRTYEKKLKEFIRKGAGLSRGRAGIATKMRYACGIPRQGFHRRRIPDAMPQRQHTA